MEGLSLIVHVIGGLYTELLCVYSRCAYVQICVCIMCFLPLGFRPSGGVPLLDISCRNLRKRRGKGGQCRSGDLLEKEPVLVSEIMLIIRIHVPRQETPLSETELALNTQLMFANVARLFVDEFKLLHFSDTLVEHFAEQDLRACCGRLRRSCCTV